MNNVPFPTPMQGVKTTQQHIGPYYFRPAHVRRDLREDQTGITLDLRLRLQSSEDGLPIPGCEVDIWSCNAHGRYSGFEYIDPDYSPGVTGEKDGDSFIRKGDSQWLRGKQISDDKGELSFLTVFPSWYFSRDIHIHIMVKKSDGPRLITQLYFAPSLVEQILQDSEYDRARERDTTYDDDWMRYVTGADDGALVNAVYADGHVDGAATLTFDPNVPSEILPEKTVFEYMPEFPDTHALWRFNKTLLRGPGHKDDA